jgi:hypothetical protein
MNHDDLIFDALNTVLDSDLLEESYAVAVSAQACLLAHLESEQVCVQGSR